MLVLLLILYGLYAAFALFVPDKNVSPCYGLRCGNGGSVDSESCSCVCPEGFHGLLCETEIMPSLWPSGSYSLLSTVYGCPEPAGYGWKHGYLNLSVSEEGTTRQWFPHLFRLLGPYHLHTIQLNFCTQISEDDLRSNNSWPQGNYCIIKAQNQSCPSGFSETNLPLRDYAVMDIEGVIPDVNISDRGLTLKLCCRKDAQNGNLHELPMGFPFYLLTPYVQDCQQFVDLVVKEEEFSFVKSSNQTWLDKNSILTVEESDIYFNLTFCYYESYERRECMYEADYGTFYRGRINVTADGKPCQKWKESNLNILSKRYPSFLSDLDFEGDFDENYCRHTRHQELSPYCIVDNTVQLCDIPLCETSDDLPNIIQRKFYRSVGEYMKTIQHIADNNIGRLEYEAAAPNQEPWLQVDLQEDYEIHCVILYKSAVWNPHLARQTVTYVSRHQWDFLTFGAHTCAGPFTTPSTYIKRYQCRRRLVGSFVTLQYHVNYDPYVNTHADWKMEVGELVIQGRATGCGKSIGITSGHVHGFQLSSSSNGPGFYAYHARLNRETGWCAEEGDRKNFLQVDLLTPMIIQGVIIQGWMDGIKPRIPNNFTLEYGNREDNLTSYVNSVGETKVFRIDGELSPNAHRKFSLQLQFLARIVRIYFYKDSSPVCAMFDLLGCPKKVEFDLKCSKDSTVIGYQVLKGHRYVGNTYSSRIPSGDVCRAIHLMKGYSGSYTYFLKSTTCQYTSVTRYNLHWMANFRTDPDDGTEYGQKMCVKDISDIYECGGIVERGRYLFSQSFPFYYGENVNCTWIARVEAGMFAKLLMIEVTLASNEKSYDKSPYFDCEDTITVYDRHREGNQIVAIMTGEPFHVLEGPQYISSSRELEINLLSCQRITEISLLSRGFKFLLNAVDCAGCGQGEYICSKQVVCSDGCGYISSPNFPYYYPVSFSCQWRIHGKMGQYINVTFDKIDVIADRECDGDYVSLFDLDLAEETSLIGKFCKLKRPVGELKSSWHMMDVNFYSDFQTNGIGFLLKYNLMSIQFDITTGNLSVECNESWYSYEDSCYSFVTTEVGLSWLDAEDQCSQVGGHLVSISNPSEMMFLHATIINNNLFPEQTAYIGLRKKESGTFQWADGTPLVYTEWYTGDAVTPRQPNGFEDEACSMIKIFNIRSLASWHDIACSYNKIKQYICEKQNDILSQRGTTDILEFPDNRVVEKEGYAFKCTTDEFISGLYVCDGKSDCSDGSDEENCTHASCPYGMFSCTDGGCIDIAFYCDHRPHCEDYSDEISCVFIECSEDKWRCDNGQCVSSTQRCDLINDCVDGSDEENCRRCREPFFQCYDGRCLPPSRVCDGFVDCGGQNGEDEGSECTTNSQPSCNDWYALGARENGKYNINVPGKTESFAVECLFDDSSGIITTLIHHSMEDWGITKNSIVFDDFINYTAPMDGIAYIVNASSGCRQLIQFDCIQNFELYEYGHWWDVKGKERSFRSEPGSSCNCILHDSCGPNKNKCECDQSYNVRVDDNQWVSDSGYIDDIQSLPITRLSTHDQYPFRAVRHSVGPLICEHPLQSDTVDLLCKNGQVVHITHKCILDYDIYHHHKGCRDLTHLQDCENFSCPDDFAKCPTSYCIPLRLVCDGRQDCPNGVDEKGCTDIRCPERFHCHRNNVCIPWQQVCDSIIHCPDGDDEYFCNVSCPETCICSGAYITCSDLYMEDIKLIPLFTGALNISSLQDKTITNHTFQHMSNLASLDLSDNGVVELEANCFSGLSNLLYLDLSNNFIKEIPIGLFHSMINLISLILKGNRISAVYPGSFDGLASLPYLDVSGMALTELAESIFQGLPSLRRLNISENKLTSVAEGAFRGTERLQYLDLRGNMITTFTDTIFTGLKDLTHLYTDRYVFCCFKPSNVPQDQCLPQADEFSSCSDLMKNETLRVSLWVLGFTALLGNLITLMYRCFFDRQSLRRSNDLFVAHLAVSDLFMGVYMLIIASADVYFRGVYSLRDVIWRSTWICHLAGFLSALSSETSVMFLCMITLERVLVIRFPFRDFNGLIQKMSRPICLTVWFIGISLAGIPLLPIQYFSSSFYSRSGVCLALPLTRDMPPGWEYSTAIFVFWNFICFVFIALGQAVIYHSVRESRKVMKGKANTDMTVARKLSFIVLTDFVCWFPICVMGLMALRGYEINAEVYAWVAVFVLPINSALNPIIYTLSSVITKGEQKAKFQHHTVSFTTRHTDLPKRNFRQMFHWLKQPLNSVNLTTYIRSNTAAGNVLKIAHKTAMFLDAIHSNGQISGKLDADCIYVVTVNGEVDQVFVSCFLATAADDGDFNKDMFDLGQLVSKMLKAYTIRKTALSCQ